MNTKFLNGACRVLLVLVFSLSLVGSIRQGITDVKQQPRLSHSSHSPLIATLELNPLPVIGERGILTCTVTSTMDAQGTTVQIELPPDARVIGGDLTWQGDIPARGQINLTVIITFLKGGDEAIYCHARHVVDARNSWGDLAELYMNIGAETSMFDYAPVPPEKRMEVGVQIEPGNGQLVSMDPSALRDAAEEVPPPPPNTDQMELQVYDYQDQTLDDRGACGTLSISGWVGYVDRDGTAKSADHLLVEVVNGSTGAHLQWCYTRDNGTFTCTGVSNPYPTGVRAVARSWSRFDYNSGTGTDILAVVDPDVGSSNDYHHSYTIWSGTLVFNAPTGCAASMGNWLIPSTNINRRAFWLQDDLIRAWEYIWYATGFNQSPQETTGSTTVEWNSHSTEGDYYTQGGNIHLKASTPISMSVANHEYGHNIMRTNYGNTFPDDNCPDPHEISGRYNLVCAWTEGWASFFALAVNNRGWFDWSDGSTFDIEKWTWDGWQEGDDVEGRVAAALWDIFDSRNEGMDVYPNGNIRDIWDVFFHQNDDTFLEYWSAWISRGYDVKFAVMSIYQSTIDYRIYKPGVFNKSLPLTGAVNLASSVTLSWGASSPTTSYEYCIDTTNDSTCGTNNTDWVSTGTATSVVISNLKPATTYYWQVRSNSATSQTYANFPNSWWSFKTTSAPAAFNKISPVSGATGQPMNAILQWGASSGALSYQYCIGTSIDNPCTTWMNNGTSTTRMLSRLDPSTTYYWHVRAVKSGFITYSNGSATAFWSFTTGPVPGGFGKTAPSNGATGISANPTLTWTASAGATSYEYCYDNSDDNACSRWTSNGSSTSKTLSGLSPSTTYFWHVRANNGNGTTYAEASATAFWSFTTGPAPAGFDKTSPSNGATVASYTPTLQWGSSSGAAYYEYCYDTSNDSTCSNWLNNGASTSKTLSALNAGTTYYWHVRAQNSSGTTYSNASVSAYWSFTTPPPDGDDINYSIGIPTLPFTTTRDTTIATTAVDDPAFVDCVRAPGNATVWYVFTPSTSGTLVVDTKGSSYDTILGVWTGNRGSLVSLGCNDNIDGTVQSRVMVSLVANTRYYIEVAEYNGVLDAPGDAKQITNPLRGVGGDLVLSARWAELLSLRSVGANDGWILESGENTLVGGSMNSTATTLRLGDDAAKKQYRGILSFATGAALPDNAVITAVTLKVKKEAVTGGGNPVTTFQGFMLDIKNGIFGTAALQVTDFQTAGNKTVGPLSPALASGWYSFNLTGAKAYINKLATGGGLTQIRLCFKLDDNNNTIANYLSLYSGNAPLASRPTLVIQYYLP